MANVFIPHTEHQLNTWITVCDTVTELLEAHPDWDPTQWTFRIFPTNHVGYLYHHLPRDMITPALQKAYDEQLPLIEMCLGDFSKPLYVPVVDRLNISALKRAWYLACCLMQGSEIQMKRKGSQSTNV